jgi:hypothetical protein
MAFDVFQMCSIEKVFVRVAILAFDGRFLSHEYMRGHFGHYSNFISRVLDSFERTRIIRLI